VIFLSRHSYGDEVRAQYDYESNLFRQIERINTAETLQKKIMNIETLDAILQPYKDQDYQDNLDDIKKKAEEELEEANKKYGKMDEKEFMNKKYKTSWAKYKALMNLAFRKGFLPQFGMKKKTVGKRGKNS